MNRKLILAILGIAFIAMALFIATNLASSSKTPQVAVEKTVKSVFTQQVNNQTLAL